MTLAHRFVEEALLDIGQAADWYNQRAPRLGQRFIDDVLHKLNLIVIFPLGYSIAHRSTRRALLREFPYAIFYEVLDGEIVVIAVLAQKEDGRRLLRRLAEA